MADAGVVNQRRERDEDRDLERLALLSLAVVSRPEEAEIRAGWEEAGEVVLSLSEALDAIARLTEAQRRTSQRVFALQLVAKIARNRGVAPLALAQAPLRALAGAALVEAERLRRSRGRGTRDELEISDPDEEAAAPQPLGAAPPPDVVEERGRDLAVEDPLTDEDPNVQAVYDGLNAAALPPDGDESAWEAFASQTKDVLALSDAELNLPKCNDEGLLETGGMKAPLIRMTFTSSKPASEFADWTDPRRWHLDCALFYSSVVAEPPVPQGDQFMQHRFMEVVEFSAEKTLETPLLFTRTVDPAGFYSLFFELPPGEVTKDIEVDTGSIVVIEDAGAPPESRTLLAADKAIAFTDPVMAGWPTIACDLFWMEFTMTAALGCPGDED